MSQGADVIPLVLDAARAQEILREVARDSGRVFFTDHAEKQMARRHITRTQVLRCLRQGRIAEGPVRSIKGNWELAVEVLSAGDVMRVAAAIDRDEDGNFVIVITAYYV